MFHIKIHEKSIIKQSLETERHSIFRIKKTNSKNKQNKNLTIVCKRIRQGPPGEERAKRFENNRTRAIKDAMFTQNRAQMKNILKENTRSKGTTLWHFIMKLKTHICNSLYVAVISRRHLPKHSLFINKMNL